jgi:hypothetical protein
MLRSSMVAATALGRAHAASDNSSPISNCIPTRSYQDLLKEVEPDFSLASRVVAFRGCSERF